VRDVVKLLEKWQIDQSDVRRSMYQAPTARERERWHAIWLLSQGWNCQTVAQALERDCHTIGAWLTAFGQNGPRALAFQQSGGSPPP
jgi:transposase